MFHRLRVSPIISKRFFSNHNKNEKQQDITSTKTPSATTKNLKKKAHQLNNPPMRQPPSHKLLAKSLVNKTKASPNLDEQMTPTKNPSATAKNSFDKLFAKFEAEYEYYLSVLLLLIFPGAINDLKKLREMNDKQGRQTGYLGQKPDTCFGAEIFEIEIY